MNELILCPEISVGDANCLKIVTKVSPPREWEYLDKEVRIKARYIYDYWRKYHDLIEIIPQRFIVKKTEEEHPIYHETCLVSQAAVAYLQHKVNTNDFDFIDTCTKTQLCKEEYDLAVELIKEIEEFLPVIGRLAIAAKTKNKKKECDGAINKYIEIHDKYLNFSSVKPECCVALYYCVLKKEATVHLYIPHGKTRKTRCNKSIRYKKKLERWKVLNGLYEENFNMCGPCLSYQLRRYKDGIKIFREDLLWIVYKNRNVFHKIFSRLKELVRIHNPSNKEYDRYFEDWTKEVLSSMDDFENSLEQQKRCKNG